MLDYLSVFFLQIIIILTGRRFHLLNEKYYNEKKTRIKRTEIIINNYFLGLYIYLFRK